MRQLSDLAGAKPPWSGPYPPWTAVPHVLTAAFIIAATAIIFLALWQRTHNP